MISLPASQLSASHRWMLFANTPRYLLKHLREDALVHKVAREHSAATILRALRQHVDRPPESLDDVAAAYVLLVSLSDKAFSEYGRELDAIKAPHIEWFEQLKGILAATFRPTLTLDIEIPQEPPQITILGDPS